MTQAAVHQYDHTENTPTVGASLVNRAADLRRRLIVAVSAAIPVVLISMVTPLQFYGWQWVVAVASLPVVTWCAWPMYVAAVRAGRHGSATMDTLVSLGAIVATAWSYLSLFFGSAGHLGEKMTMSLVPRAISPGAHLYFEGAVMVITFVLCGRYMEAISRYRAGDAVRALLDLQARTAQVVQANGEVKETPVEDIHPGDIVRVAVGGRIPVDGIVKTGSSSVDTAAITGESMPQKTGVGQPIFAGYVNLNGPLDITVTGSAQDTRLARIGRLVAQVQAEKPPIQRLVDRIAGVFVPVVIAIALIAFVAWLFAGGSWATAITAATAVLVVACPCALGLATPTALLVGTGRAAQLGIVVANAEALEQARDIDTVVFDKTGTLTVGKPQLVASEIAATPEAHAQLDALGVDQAGLLHLVGELERASTHPVAVAITAAGQAQKPADNDGKASEFLEISEVAGKGVRGQIGSHEILVGSARWLGEEGITPAAIAQLQQQLTHPEASVSFVAVRGVAATQPAAAATSAIAAQTKPVTQTQTITSPTGKVVTLAVSGMTCASCVRRVEKRINRVPGANATVNLAMETAIVQAAADVTPDSLIQAVKDAGYDASLVNVETETATPTVTESVPVSQHELVGTTPLVLVAALEVADQPRASAQEAIRELTQMGVRSVMLTGDRESAAQAIATRVGISANSVCAGVGPEGKQEYVRALQLGEERGVTESAEDAARETVPTGGVDTNTVKPTYKHAVAVVGDGINDAAALAQAGAHGIGIAMGQGTDAAIQAADMVISRSDPRAVPTALRIARATIRTIRSNLMWAFLYNVIAIPLAAAGLVSPMIAAAAMAGSSVLVVGNSLRLRTVD